MKECEVHFWRHLCFCRSRIGQFFEEEEEGENCDRGIEQEEREGREGIDCSGRRDSERARVPPSASEFIFIPSLKSTDRKGKGETRR